VGQFCALSTTWFSPGFVDDRDPLQQGLKPYAAELADNGYSESTTVIHYNKD